MADVRMLRFSLRLTRMDRIRNEDIREKMNVNRIGLKLREARLRWYGHVKRREVEYVGRKVMDLECPGKRKRGRPKRRFMDGIKEDMKEVGAEEQDISDRGRWRGRIRCGDP